MFGYNDNVWRDISSCTETDKAANLKESDVFVGQGKNKQQLRKANYKEIQKDTCLNIHNK